MKPIPTMLENVAVMLSSGRGLPIDEGRYFLASLASVFPAWSHVVRQMQDSLVEHAGDRCLYITEDSLFEIRQSLAETQRVLATGVVV